MNYHRRKHALEYQLSHTVMPCLRLHQQPPRAALGEIGEGAELRGLAAAL